MFNNPFDSFHNTVAEAKEERERLYRLLTISTPRERLLVAGIASLLLFLAAWLVLGGVTRTVSVVGVLVEPGEAASEVNRPLEALMWIPRDVAPRLAPGMRVVVEFARADGGADARGGRIAMIASVPYSGPLAGLEAAAPVAAHLLHVALDEAPDVEARAGTQCRIAIELGRQSLVTLFGVSAPGPKPRFAALRADPPSASRPRRPFTKAAPAVTSFPWRILHESAP
ncbi:MAG: hypothetical protein OXG82_06400 [Gammaproteobacteria bacterium]|nr:hypothetical protein [Gammaproteobacteria bacterium]